MRRTFLVVALVLGSMLAGCGDDGGGNGVSAGAGAELTSAQCQETASAMTSAAAGIPQALTGAGAGLKDAVARLDAFADAAPSEIRADVRVIAEAYGDFITAMASANYDPSSGQAPSATVIAQLQVASGKVQTAEFQAASERVSTWFRDKCGK